MPDTKPVLIPKVSMATEEVTFVEWLVADGADVSEGEPIYSVATDKVESSIEASVAGVLRHGVAEEDEQYAVGAQIGHIEPA